MIRKNTNGDISDEEYDRILKPFNDCYCDFVISYIMPEVLTNDLKMLKNEAKNIVGFNKKFFVSGDAFPVSSNALSNHKNTRFQTFMCIYVNQ